MHVCTDSARAEEQEEEQHNLVQMLATVEVHSR